MNDLYVAADHRGEGLGRALIEASVGVARQANAMRRSLMPPRPESVSCTSSAEPRTISVSTNACEKSRMV